MHKEELEAATLSAEQLNRIISMEQEINTGAKGQVYLLAVSKK